MKTSVSIYKLKMGLKKFSSSYLIPEIQRSARPINLERSIIMYEIFRDNRKVLTREQIEKQYSGKWIFIVNDAGPFFSPNEDGELEPCPFSAGEVLVVADHPYEGRESGIYEELKQNRSKYGSIHELDLRNHPKIPQHWNPVTGGTSLD